MMVACYRHLNRRIVAMVYTKDSNGALCVNLKLVIAVVSAMALMISGLVGNLVSTNREYQKTIIENQNAIIANQAKIISLVGQMEQRDAAEFGRTHSEHDDMMDRLRNKGS